MEAASIIVDFRTDAVLLFIMEISLSVYSKMEDLMA
jgi:hypothetical protein